jgi:hypothetical protein
LIDHPPGGHDDLANVIAGVADAVTQHPVTAGVIGSGPIVVGPSDSGPPVDAATLATETPLGAAWRTFEAEQRTFQREQDAHLRERRSNNLPFRAAMARTGRVAPTIFDLL